MRRLTVTLTILLLLLISGSCWASEQVAMITIEGAIDPSIAGYVQRGLEQAEEQEAQCLIIRMDTPGGLDASMREIAKALLDSRLPTVVYIWPSGGRAASAGMIISLAADIVAMAPGTNIGAAHPVQLGGGESASETMTEKITSDAAAFARTLATKRGRNVQWAEKAVRRSVSATEREALKLGVIDLIAHDLPSLLKQLDGRKVKRPNETLVLKTESAQVEEIKPNIREQFLHILAHPNIAYILLIIAFYGIIFELQSPGAIFPGVVGGICLILAFYSLAVLPLNVAGLALLLLGIGLFIIDIKVVSHGVLSVGGVIAFGVGSLMLFGTRSPAFRVSWQIALFMTLITASFFIFVVGLAVKAQRGRIQTGKEGLVGEKGVANSRLDPEGAVFVAGEIWKAKSEGGEIIEKDQPIEVVEVDGLEVMVRLRLP